MPNDTRQRFAGNYTRGKLLFFPHGTVFIKNKQQVRRSKLGLPGAGASRTYHRYVGYKGFICRRVEDTT